MRTDADCEAADDLEMGMADGVCSLGALSDSASDAVLGTLESASEDGQALDSQHVGFHPASSWTVGRDCGTWISHGGTNAARLQTSRALLTNLFVNVRRLPSSLAQAVLQALRPQTRIATRVVDCVVSALCGVGQNLARQHFNAIRSNTWDPVRPEPQSVFIPMRPWSQLLVRAKSPCQNRRNAMIPKSAR